MHHRRLSVQIEWILGEITNATQVTVINGYPGKSVTLGVDIRQSYASWWLPEHHIGVVTQSQCLGWHINDDSIAFATDIFTYRLSPAAPSCSTSPKPTFLKSKTTWPPIWPREVQWPPPWGIWTLLCSLLMSASRRLSEEGYTGCKSIQFLTMKHQSK